MRMDEGIWGSISLFLPAAAVATGTAKMDQKTESWHDTLSPQFHPTSKTFSSWNPNQQYSHNRILAQLLRATDMIKLKKNPDK